MGGVSSAPRHMPYGTGVHGGLVGLLEQRAGERGDPDKPYACPQCGKRYGWKKSLNLHIRQECGKDPQFQCPLCDYRSKQKSNLVSHIRHRHEKDLATAKQLAKVRPQGAFLYFEAGSESPASSS